MKYKYVVTVLVWALLFTTCMIFNTYQINQKGEYYYDNEFIVKDQDSYSYRTRRGENTDFSFKDFNGTETIVRMNQVSMIEIEMDSEINQGEFKIVMITPSNEIIELHEGINYFNLSETGEYRVKIVGNQATGKMKLDYVYE